MKQWTLQVLVEGDHVDADAMASELCEFVGPGNLRVHDVEVVEGWPA